MSIKMYRQITSNQEGDIGFKLRLRQLGDCEEKRGDERKSAILCGIAGGRG